MDAAEQLSALFKAMGHETFVANDGGEAVHAALATKPDIVFLDLDMPVLTGYQVARAIRDEQIEPQPFLIALTASHGTSVEVAIKAVGFNSYVRKPADTYALIALVTDLAARPRS
jgi:CheY-like chemotaxis protein